MARLSNIFSGDDSPASSGGEISYRLAWPGELRTALCLILGNNGQPASDPAISDFIGYAQARGIDLKKTWVAQGAQLLWSVLPVVSPGRTMLLLTPSDAPTQESNRVAAELVIHACDHHAKSGIRLAQALVDPDNLWLKNLVLMCGFEPMAELTYLQAAPRRTASIPPLPPGLSLKQYTEESHAKFVSAIRDSYQQSLDCPKLNGLREMEDIVAGHKATGEFDPQLWYLVSEGEKPLAVLLLSRLTRSDTIELVYLGLVPEARGRGIGDWLMRLAMGVVRRENFSFLTLAVDSLNTHALKLYYRHGMQRIGKKVALMKVFPARADYQA